jgi:ATP-binding protein involved in chromosome partitioning
MLPLNEENILQALKAVQDPDLHRDIVTLNFVKNLKISGNNVSFTLELTTPACPVRDKFKPTVNMQSAAQLRASAK